MQERKIVAGAANGKRIMEGKFGRRFPGLTVETGDFDAPGAPERLAGRLGSKRRAEILTPIDAARLERDDGVLRT